MEPVVVHRPRQVPHLVRGVALCRCQVDWPHQVGARAATDRRGIGAQPLGNVVDQRLPILIKIAEQRFGEIEPIRAEQRRVGELDVEVPPDGGPRRRIEPGTVQVEDRPVRAHRGAQLVDLNPVVRLEAGVREREKARRIVGVPPFAVRRSQSRDSQPGRLVRRRASLGESVALRVPATDGDVEHPRAGRLIDSACAPPLMNVCTLVRPAGERVTVGGGCRSSGAKASFRATLRGGRGSAGSQSRSRWPSPPPPSSTITITDGAAAVKLRQRTAPRSVVTVPPAWASQSVKRASPPCTVPVVFSTTRPMGNRDWSWTKSVRLMVHPSAPPWTSIVAPRRPLPMNALSPQPVGRRFQTRSWRARNTGQSTRVAGVCSTRSNASNDGAVMAASSTEWCYK